MTERSPTPAVPDLIAHRGDAARFPENTIPALLGAIDAGARYVEFDVQLSADRVPVLMHDDDLRRMTGARHRVMDVSSSELRHLVVRRPKGGAGQAGAVIPMLAEVMDILRMNPLVTAFVELKPESLERFGVEVMVERVREVLEPVAGQCVIISFEREAIELARAIHAADSIGWVLNAWGEGVRRQATTLAPEFLFCNHKILPRDASPLWPGPWRWAIYEVVDPALALELAARGAHLVETMDISMMLGHAMLRASETGGRGG